MNLTKELTAIIPINKLAKEQWKDRTINMIENMEYGFIFYNLLTNYSNEYKKNKTYNLEKLLFSNNLPKKKKCLQIIEDSFDNVKTKLSKLICLNETFQELSDIGKEILQKRGLDGQTKSTKQILINKEFFPDVICNDTDFEIKEFNYGQIVNNPPTKISSEHRYSFSDILNQKLEEFYQIRGI